MFGTTDGSHQQDCHSLGGRVEGEREGEGKGEEKGGQRR